MDFYFEENWLQKVKKQEELLVYKKFTRETALELGLKLVEVCETKYRKPAAIRIIEDGVVVFAYKMAGTGSENDWWMDRKLAFSRLTGYSSLGGYLRMKAGELENTWEDRIDNMATCGGCVPVCVEQQKSPWAYVIVSGMDHEEDHQAIIDAMAMQLGIEVPSLIG